MFLYQVQKALAEVVRVEHHKSDVTLQKLFAKLGKLVEADRQKPQEVPGFPELNKISTATKRVLEKINQRCEEGYDYTIW